MAKKWMQKAFANSHGQFSANAHKHGMSTQAFAKKETAPGSHASAHVKRQANLAKIAHGVNHTGHKHGH